MLPMTKLTTQSSNNFETLERFVALSNGEYWQANKAVEDREIGEGEVLMIAGIDMVDGSPHTIRVRLHPSKVTSWKKEVKFLIEEFLSVFEFLGKEKAQSVREAEIKAIQDKLKSEQELLQEVCVDMEMMDRLIEEETPKEEAKTNLPIKHEAIGADVLGAVRTQKVSALMSGGLTANGIEQIKSGMEEQRNIAVKRSDWISNRTKKLSQIAEEMTPYFEEKAAVALALTKDMRDHVDALMKGIGNLNLYVLKNVEIETLKAGSSASESEKLTLTQRVLFMDEELAVFEDVHDEFDCHDRNSFFDAIAKHQGLIDQIFPANRCVVALAATRKQHDYQSRGYHSIQADKLKRENQRQFMLVRDGDNIHLVLSPELWHQSSRTLFPTFNESDGPFQGIDGGEITYRDLEYTDALAAHEVIALGYKRMLILLCGLDHNKKLFGEFYPGEPTLGFVSTEFQETYFNFIHDVDGVGMLPPYCQKSIYEWADQMNEEVGVGSRVIIRWRELFSIASIPSCFERENRWNSGCGNSRDLQYTPNNSNRSGFIEGNLIRNQGRYILEIAVEGSTANYEDRSFIAKLDMSYAMKHADKFDFLCVDRLNPDDAKWYLNNRPSRNLNVVGIRLLKQAIKMAEEDRLREKTLRDALLNALIVGNVSEDTETAIRLIDKGIAKYKCAHPKRDILSLLNDKKGFNFLCDQLYQLSEKGHDLTEEVKISELDLGRKVIRVSLLANGQYCAYSTSLEKERDNRMMDFYWVAKTCYKSTKKGVRAQKRTFSILKTFVNDETVLFQSDNIADFSIDQNVPFKSPRAKAKFLDDIIEDKGLLTWSKMISMKNDEKAICDFMEQYTSYRERLTYNSELGRVVEPYSRVVIGATYVDKVIHKIVMECVTYDLVNWLIGGIDSLVEEFTDIHSEIYCDKSSARKRVEKNVERFNNVPLHEVMSLKHIDRKAITGLLVELKDSFDLSKDKYKNYSLTGSIDKLKNKDVPVFIIPEIGVDLDLWVGINKPNDFEPFFYHNGSFGAGGTLDIFVCNDESKDKLASVCKVLNNLDEIEKRFKQTGYTHCNNEGDFDVTCEWVEIEPRELRSIKAYKSYDYKEVSRIPRGMKSLS
jgi:hypothetical protein